MTLIERHGTAKARIELSRPVALALGDGVLRPGESVFDYGCGRGGDVVRLNDLGYDVAGWDPAFAPREALREADVVNLGYVLNVIEDLAERREALETAWRLARRVLVVSARPSWEGNGLAGRPHLDGWLTAKGTFQRFFDQEELRSLIDGVLGAHASRLHLGSSTSSETSGRPSPSGPARSAAQERHAGVSRRCSSRAIARCSTP